MQDSNFEELRNALCEKPIQPRLIDFFVTQKCKQNPFFYYSTSNGAAYALTDVYSDYKLHLKGFHKKYFL